MTCVYSFARTETIPLELPYSDCLISLGVTIGYLGAGRIRGFTATPLQTVRRDSGNDRWTEQAIPWL